MAKIAVQLELSSKSLRAIMPTDSNGMASKSARRRVAEQLAMCLEKPFWSFLTILNGLKMI